MLGILAVLMLVVSVVSAEDPPLFLLKWGSHGHTGDGLFNYPTGISTDSLGNVYVADYGNHRIQKFDSTGTYTSQWGTNGIGNGEFKYPYSIAIFSMDAIYVSDTGNDRIQKFNSTGTYISQWGTSGTGDGQFGNPSGVAVDTSGNVYVADVGLHRIQKFTSDGVYITQWGGLGAGDGEFSIPESIAIGTSGNVYVADYANNRIQKFTSSGTYITKWGLWGTGDGNFKFPEGIATDSSGNVYVSDVSLDRIQKFDSDGTFITKWGSSGTGNEEFEYPEGIIVDSSGNVYVVDTNNHRIQKFGYPPPVTYPHALQNIVLAQPKPYVVNITGNMVGTTDSGGSVDFVMIPAVKYAIQYTKPEQSIDEVRYYYPSEDEYHETFWSEMPGLSSGQVLHTFYSRTNGTNTDLGLSYRDISAHGTSKLTFFVKDEDKTVIYTHDYLNTSIINVTYLVPTTQGAVFYWGFNATVTDYAEPIALTNYIRFDTSQWRINPMRAPNGDPMATFVYNLVAIAVVNLAAYIFGSKHMNAGLSLITAMVLVIFFFWIGWLQASALMVGVGMALAVIWYLRYAEREMD
jgi:sugar lactone lactonase YvrE